VTTLATITGDIDNSEMVFASPSGQFYHDWTTSHSLSGLSHLDNFIMTLDFSSVYRDFAKTKPVSNTDVVAYTRILSTIMNYRIKVFI
jgi:hypothetical protein